MVRGIKDTANSLIVFFRDNHSLKTIRFDQSFQQHSLVTKQFWARSLFCAKCPFLSWQRQANIETGREMQVQRLENSPGLAMCLKLHNQKLNPFKLKQWSQPGAVSSLGDPWQDLETFLVVTTKIGVAAGIQQVESTCLNVLESMGQPPNKGFSGPNVNSITLKNPRVESMTFQTSQMKMKLRKNILDVFQMAKGRPTNTC